MATHSTTASRAGGDPAAYEQMNALLAQNWWAFALRGVLGIIFGLIAFFLPGVTMLSLVLVFSAYALVDGVFAIIAAGRAMRAMGISAAGGYRRHHRGCNRIPVARHHSRKLRLSRRHLGNSLGRIDAERSFASSTRSRPMVARVGRSCIGDLWRVADCGSLHWSARIDLVARCLCHRIWLRTDRSCRQAARATA